MVVFIAIIFLFTACSSDTCATFEELSSASPLDELSPAQPLMNNPELENLVLMIKTELTLTTQSDFMRMFLPDHIPTTVTVIIQNNSHLPLFTGLHFTLEVYDKGHWLCVPMVETGYSVEFADVAIGILPHYTKSFDKDLTYFQVLEAERYRIRKSVGIDTWRAERDSPEPRHEIVAEFIWNR